MTGVLFTVGFVCVVVGAIWRAWDHNATAPGWWLGIGLLCILPQFAIEQGWVTP